MQAVKWKMAKLVTYLVVGSGSSPPVTTGPFTTCSSSTWWGTATPSTAPGAWLLLLLLLLFSLLSKFAGFGRTPWSFCWRSLISSISWSSSTRPFSSFCSSSRWGSGRSITPCLHR